MQIFISKKVFFSPSAPQAHCLLIVQLFFHYSVDKMGVGLIETELALLYFKIHSWNIFFLSSPSRLFVQVQWWEKVGNENSSVSLKVWFARSNDNNQNAIKDILVIWIDILALVPKPERKRTLSSIKMICMPMHQQNKKIWFLMTCHPKNYLLKKFDRCAITSLVLCYYLSSNASIQKAFFKKVAV